jgi:two-component system, LytTR family, sensor histidine kinase AlgZ
VENAFKHGVEHLRTDAYVHLTLKATANSVSFSVENNFDHEEVSTQPGLGLSNLKRRLELVYPKKHNLSILKTDTAFTAQLSIDQL